MALTPEILRKRVLKAVRSDANLHAYEQVLVKIRHAMAQPSTSARDIAAIIQTEPVLTARTLRVVNSAAFGLRRPVCNLDEAVVVLGTHQVRDLCSAMTMGLFLQKKEKQSKYLDREAFWLHSFGTAVIARMLHEEFIGGQGPEIYIAGLLCNVGRILLAQFFPELCDKMCEYSLQASIPLLEAEKRVIGCTHAEVGAWLAKAWQLDDGLVQSIRYHHGPSGNNDAELINFAYVLAQLLELGDPGEKRLTRLIPGVLAKFELDKKSFSRVYAQLEATAEDVKKNALEIIG